MKQSTTDKARGEFHEVKGKVKENVGRATNNPDLEAEGQGEKIGGKVQKKIGQVEKVLGKIVWAAQLGASRSRFNQETCSAFSNKHVAYRSFASLFKLPCNAAMDRRVPSSG